MRRPVLRCQGFTLIELLVTIAIAGLLLTIAVPSFRDFILMQRLRSDSAQMTTDFQYARSEAISRNTAVWVDFRSNAAMSCYTIYTSPGVANRCNCLLGAEAACVAPTRELRTVQLPASLSVGITLPNAQDTAVGFDPASGGLLLTYWVFVPGSVVFPNFVVDMSLDASRVIRTSLSVGGLPLICAPASPSVGVPAC